MSGEKSYKQLIVWQRSIQLVKAVYFMTGNLPNSELYGLCSQMRRSAVSIPSNIAEGYKRKNRREYLQFLHIADSSAAELETQTIIVKEIFPKINTKETQKLLMEVQKMLFVLIKKLETTS